MSKKALCVLRKDIISDEALKSGSDTIVNINVNSIFKCKTYLLDRAICETDENYLQIIPYITLVDNKTNEIFVYKRGSASHEKRLVGECSIGIGGHIEYEPTDTLTIKELITNETMRELTEEVGLIDDRFHAVIGYKYDTSNFGLIHIRSNDVGKVHIGLSMFLKINKSDMNNLEKDVICNGEWLSIDDVKNKIDNKEINLESWSKFVFGIILNETQ